ncbi:hypothetical protein N665_1053s0005 [Sinapis alba]|nr:hypothetical protein N665_1053s0005 [Sinapis alba]
MADNLMNQDQSIVRAFYKQNEAAKNEYKIRMNASIDAWHDESVESANRGKFIELVKYAADQNELVSKVVLENAPKNNQMVSHKIQKELAHCFAEEVIQSIIQELDHDVFCLMVDESADVSTKEQVAVVFRFVDKKGIVKEKIVGLIHVQETSSASLKSVIDSLFAKHGLSMKKLRGQGYDGASNMKGEFNGLRSLILRENSSAYYVHCFAHQLQLAVVAVVKKHFEVSDFFDKISILLNVVGASCKRQDMIREDQHKIIEEGLMLLLLGLTNNLSMALQNKDQDILNAMSLVKSTKQQLCKLRDNGWGSVIEKEFNDRFDEVNTELLGCTASLSPIDSFYQFDQPKVVRLSEFYPEDFSSMEWISLEHQLGIYIDNISEDQRFANLEGLGDLARVMLVLTLPVATATVERSFSAMKIVKTTLRNRMSDEFLNDCMICYIEKDHFDKVTNDLVIKRFQSMGERRMTL